MTRFDSPAQVVILFTGAVLVSFVLIIFLNAEASHRKIVKEPEIENGNLFSSLGREVRQIIKGWVQENSTGEGEGEGTENSGGMSRSRVGRSLKSLGGRGFDSLQHPVRHAKHKSKQQEATPTTDTATPSQTTTTTTTTTSTPIVEDESENTTVARNDSSKIVTKRRLDAHDICYNTHEVLLIITITCGVNFAFVFFVMICVRTCSRNNKVEDIYVPCGGDSPTHTDDELCNYKSYSAAEDYCHSGASSYSSVQEYVNSLPQGNVGSMLSLHSMYSPHLPLHPGGENSRRKSRNSLHTAYSMEDLLLI